MKTRLKERDHRIVIFLSTGLVATTQQINHMFFKTEMSYRRRLLQLTKNHTIKRYRPGNDSCVYYVDSLPKDWRKRVFWTDILIYLTDYMEELNDKLGTPNAYQMVDFKIEKSISVIVCDLWVVLKTPKGGILLMIQASKRGAFNAKPFERLRTHYLNEFKETLRSLEYPIIENFQYEKLKLYCFRVISCFPKDTEIFPHISLSPKTLKEDIHLIFDSF